MNGKKRFGTRLFVLMMAAMPLVGCATNSTTINDMPADLAWIELDQAVQDEKLGRSLTGWLIDYELPANMEEARAEAREAAKDSDTPGDALKEMASDIAQWLVANLPEPKYRAGLVVGRLGNELEDNRNLQNVLDQLANTLQRNKKFNDNFYVIGSKASDAQELLDEVSGRGWLDPVGENEDEVSLKRPHPDDVYLLTGSLYSRPERDGKELGVEAFIQIQKPRELGRVVTQDSFVRHYYYHPTLEAHESETENAKKWDEWLKDHPGDAKHRN